jgi:hypothetical protein
VYNKYFVDHAYTISISNNTNNYKEYLISYAYPDTSIPFNQSLIAGIRPYSIAFLDNNKYWVNVIKNTATDKISIIYFATDTLLKYPGYTVRVKKKILCRKDYST